MKSLFRSSLCVGAFALLSMGYASAEESLTVKEIKIEELGCPLPPSLQLNAQISRLKQPEAGKHLQKILPGASPDFLDDSAGIWFTVRKASDGTLYLTDELANTLWLRQADQWKCQLANISTRKTFGGVMSHLAVRYLGKGLFAFAETAPDETEEKSEDGFPQAYAITYLLDSKNDKILERTPSYLYNHNPPVKPDPSWAAKYQLPSVQEDP